MTTATLEKVHQTFVTIEKVDAEKRLVFGIASSEAVDSDGETITFDAIKGAIAEYMKFGNLREMHNPKGAAGVVLELVADEVAKVIRIVAKVVDDAAWEKVKEGVYKGFSIGGRALERLGRQITKLYMSEISLVDRPANPLALIELFKAEDGQPLNQALLEFTEAIGKAKKDLADILAKAQGTQIAIVPVSDDVRKNFYSVGTLARIIEDLNFLYCSSTMEEQNEKDVDSKVPAMLAQALNTLGSTLVEMAAEEFSELNLGASIASVSKGDQAVAKVKKEDVYKRLAKAEETLKAMKAGFEKAEGDDVEGDDVDKAMADMCGSATQKVDSSDELTKAVQSGDMRKVLAVVATAQSAQRDQKIDELTKAMASLTDTVQKLSKEPLAPKALAQSLTKVEDSKPANEPAVKDDLQKAIEAKDPVAVAKAIHAGGGTVLQAGAQ